MVPVCQRAWLALATALGCLATGAVGAQPLAHHGKSSVMAAAASLPDALVQLAAQWGEAVAPGAACESLRQRAALACFDSRGGLALLRQLDRPVLLRLSQAAGSESRVLLLVGMGADEASFLAGGQTVRLPLSQLAEVWRGEFLTLWRAPAMHPGGVPQTLHEPLRQWLHRQLPPADPAPASVPLGPETVLERLAGFQMSQGLKPDGKAGPVTMMALNRRLGLEEPRLLPPPP